MLFEYIHRLAYAIENEKQQTKLQWVRFVRWNIIFHSCVLFEFGLLFAKAVVFCCCYFVFENIRWKNEKKKREEIGEKNMQRTNEYTNREIECHWYAC